MAKDPGKSKFSAYVSLTKPGIIRGNIMTAIAGFLFATHGRIQFALLFWTLIGTSLVIASGCVFNNYIDRDIDTKMDRTKKRAIATGLISGRNAITYGIILALCGFWALSQHVNTLTFILGIIALFFYVVAYGWAKRKSVHGTLVGSIPGAMSLVAGYTAITNHFDGAALILFLIMAVWQMPHFYAIAVYRKKEYASAGLPVLPVVKGELAAKKQILVYIVLFAATTAALYIYNYASWEYLVVMLIVSFMWLRLSAKGFKAKDNIKWGKKVFGFSLLTLTIFCLMISVNSLLK